MKVLKRICLLTIALIGCTILLCCSKETQSAYSLLSPNKNVADQNTTNSNSNVHRFEKVEFERNRDLWNSKNIKNYRMIVEARFFANVSNQVLINVENHKAEAIKNTSNFDKGSPETYKVCDTIEKIFALIERAQENKAEILNVEYDGTLGHPTQVIIDGRKQTADGEMSVRIQNLEVIK